MEKSKKLMYILGIILAVSVILNIWFVYKLRAGEAWPPANFKDGSVQLHDAPIDNSDQYLQPSDISN